MKSTSDSKLILRTIATPLILLAAIMLAAGRSTYWQGWIFGGVNFALLIVNYLVLRERPDLIQERLTPGKGTKWWDKVYFAVTTPLFFITIILAALDAGRFYWSPALPLWVYVVSIAAYLAGQAIHLWAKRTNRWFATVAFMLATPLILGSWLALIPQAVTAAFLLARTCLEDRLLLDGLPDYAEYAKQVRHRLLPL